ncbi:MAG: FAD-dependent oxidoreductase [Patescibacteria group bacterium]
MIYDLAICGGGPAGVAAGVYASRKRLSTVFITSSFESQSTVSENIQNWIGTVAISGQNLADNLKKHIEAYADDVVNIREDESVIKISKNGRGENFLITTDTCSYEARTVLIATGSHRRKLDIPGAMEFENKGVTYCASCDGPLFAGKDVAVVGGGNAGFETAAQLLAYAKSVTLFNRSTKFKADPVTVKKVMAHPKMRAFNNVRIKKIEGGKFVTSLTYTDDKSGADTALPVQGIFVEIGLIPNTVFAKELIDLNKYGQIPIDPRNQTTKMPGVWAAGDCTDGLYHQNNIAAGDAVKALEDIYLYLRA